MAWYIFRVAARALSYALYVLTLVSAYGGAISPRWWALPSVLTLAFPYLAAATILTGAAWLLAKRFMPAIAAALTLVVCWGAVTQALVPAGSSKNPTPGNTEFTLVTYNIYDGNDLRQPDTKPSRALSYLLEADADIVCLQEAYSLKFISKGNEAQYDSLNRLYPYQINGGSVDLTILSKYPMEKVTKAGKNEGGGGSYMVARVDVKGHQLYVVNVHLANYSLTEEERKVVTEMKSVEGVKTSLEEMKMSILDKLKSSFRERAENVDDLRKELDRLPGALIVCGDFNDVPCSWAYRKVKGEDFSDAFNMTNLVTKNTYNLHAFYFRIDQILYREHTGLEPLRVDRNKIDCSDHYPLEAAFVI